MPVNALEALSGEEVMVVASDCPRPVLGFTIDILDDEAILFHPATLAILRLNRSAALIWQLCDGQRSIADRCDLLAGAYPNSADQIGRSVSKAQQAFDRDTPAFVNVGTQSYRLFCLRP